MSAERDELADLIEDAVADAIYNSADAPPSLTGIVASVATDAILAAGWVKPRTITTAEELDALPNESLILDAQNKCREGLTSVAGRNWWRAMGPGKVILSKEIPLPATVLHEGQA